MNLVAKLAQDRSALRTGKCYYFIDPTAMFGQPDANGNLIGITDCFTFKQFLSQVRTFRSLGINIQDPCNLIPAPVK